jgi:hypothetical protein
LSGSFGGIRRMLSLREKKKSMLGRRAAAVGNVEEDQDPLATETLAERETPFERLAMLDCVTNNVVLNERRSPSNWRFLFAQDYLQAF